MSFAVGGVLFVGRRLQVYGSEIDFAQLTPMLWLGMGALSIAYAAGGAILVAAWRNLLFHFGCNVEWGSALRIYGTTQLGKYVPGNIFQLASRQAVGMAAGLSAWPLAKATAWEIGLLAVAGVTCGTLIVPAASPGLTQVDAVLAFVASTSVVAIAIYYYWGRGTALAFGCYTGFLLVSGIMFFAVFAMLFGRWNGVPGIVFCGAYLVGWLVGFLTPGAPGGLGVREVVVLFLLKGYLSETDLLLAIAITRSVTVIGDVLLFVAVTLLVKRYRGDEV